MSQHGSKSSGSSFLLPPSLEVRFTVGDIATMSEVGAICISANRRLEGHGGTKDWWHFRNHVRSADEAVYKVGGMQLREHLSTMCFDRPGEIFVTPGFDFPTRFILHALLPDFPDAWDAKRIAPKGSIELIDNSWQVISSLYADVFRRADSLGVLSLCLCALGCGCRQWPAEDIATIAMKCLRKLKFQHLQLVEFVFTDESVMKCFSDVAKSHLNAMIPRPLGSQSLPVTWEGKVQKRGDCAVM